MPSSTQRGSSFPPSLIGRLIAGKVEILDLIAGGGMGWVFRARHRPLNKLVAVKVLRFDGESEGEDTLRTQRFAQEAQAASLLEHPNSVQIFDFGEDGEDRLLYLVMEYLDGADLQAIVDRGPLAPARTIGLVAQALAALAAAHDRDLIHRDMKPSNVIVLQRKNDDGDVTEVVKVCDFGLARFNGAKSKLTLDRGTRVLGTPHYMSPEQAVGEKLDGRSDVYSVGCVLYELLSGAPPFQSDSWMTLLMKHVSETPVPIASRVLGLDPQLARLVHAALEKDAAHRPTARELRRGLLEIGGVPPGGTPLPALTPRGPIERAPSADVLALPDDAILFDSVPPTPPPLEALRDDSIRESGSHGVFSLIEGSTPSPGGPDFDALVGEAVASVQELQDGSARDGSEAIDGLDHRRAASHVADHAMYMWRTYGLTDESYRGPEPFFIRDHRGTFIGPRSSGDALRVLQVVCAAGFGEGVMISADRRLWMPAPEFLRLTGQESLLDQPHVVEDATRMPFAGSFARQTLASLLGRVFREAPTGRLMFQLDPDDPRSERLEIHLIRGAPTFVYSSEAALQIPVLLVDKGLVSAEQLPQLLRRVLLEERRLEEVIGRGIGPHVQQHRAAFMKERLLRLMAWGRRGRFHLDAQLLPTSVTPFTRSAISMLPDLVYRGLTLPQLRTHLAPFMKVTLVRSERLGAGIGELGFSEPQLALVRNFLRAPHLNQAVGEDRAQERQILALAYVLLETGMLLRPL